MAEERHRGLTHRVAAAALGMVVGGLAGRLVTAAAWDMLASKSKHASHVVYSKASRCDGRRDDAPASSAAHPILRDSEETHHMAIERNVAPAVQQATGWDPVDCYKQMIMARTINETLK